MSHAFTKDGLFDHAVELGNLACDGLGVERPTARRREIRGACGYYHFQGRRVSVDIEKAQLPGRGYSWPGSCSDRTPYGITAHEYGHHVWYVLGLRRKDFPRGGPRVSSYEPVIEEAFAETFRLFLLNPDLLAAGRPRRYEYMLSTGLRPLWGLTWREVLEPAPTRFKAQCERWLTKE